MQKTMVQQCDLNRTRERIVAEAKQGICSEWICMRAN
jgi:hypothetical protein